MNVIYERSKRLGRIGGLPDAMRRSTTSAGLSSSESCSLSSLQRPTFLSGRRSSLSRWHLRNVSYDASLSLRTFCSLWKCPSSTMPTMMPSPWMLTLLCNLNRRQSSNERTSSWISQRVLSSLSLTSGRKLPTKKGPIRGNPRIWSCYFSLP